MRITLFRRSIWIVSRSKIQKTVTLFTSEQEEKFLDACDDWQLPIFATLMMTGLRPGELSHLLLPDDLDLEEGILYVRNKPELDRRVKTRNEREIPLVPPLIKLLRSTLGRRSTGLMFLRRSLCRNSQQLHSLPAKESMAVEFTRRKNQWKSGDELLLSRKERSRIARTVWKDAGLIKTEMIRKEFMRLTKHIDCPEMTAPKMLRHLFATTLQEGNVDPLVRCELMGHSVAANSNATHGLEMTAN